MNKSAQFSVGILIVISLVVQCRPKEDSTVTQFTGKPEIPAVIKRDHEYLLSEIAKLALLQDSTGKAAVKLKELMQHHFKEEEDYVLPPLGLLPLLAEGKLPALSEEIISLTEKLKAQQNHMIAEHQLIKAFMDEMKQAAALENHPEVFSLEREISRHAANEEEIYYPAAILIGDFLQLKTGMK